MRMLLAAAAAAFVFAASGAAHAQAGDCAGLAKLDIPNVTITSAALTPAGAPVATGLENQKPLTFDIAFCRVAAIATPTPDSAIGMEVWLPANGAWNGKYLQVGNGGYAGAISVYGLANGVRRGYAVAATDDGHQSKPDDGVTAAWAQGHPEKIVDFAWRAVNQTTLAAKTIVLVYEGAPAKLSYFAGCSTGGREALLSAQRFPLSFDGILAGAPAAPMTSLLTSAALLEKPMTLPGAWIAPAKLPALQKAALAACGDGKSYVADPARCKFDPKVLACKSKETDQCLTKAQVATARQIYAGAKAPGDGRWLYGQTPGAEGLKGSWDNWIVGKAPGREGNAAGEEFGRNFYAYMVLDKPDLRIQDVSEADMIKGRAMYGALIDAENPDLSAFKARGGKLIQYHGWNDPAIPPKFSVEYFNAVQKQMGDTKNFYRLFMVPGMLHCGGGDAPTNVDWLTLLEDWVERGKAPDQAVAKGQNGDTQTILPYKS
jgi:feruloyl esterase